MTSLSRLRFWTNEDAKHRAEGDAITALREPLFTPRHCRGELDNGLCLSHDHPGEALAGVLPLANFAGLNEPVTAARPAACRPFITNHNQARSS